MILDAGLDAAFERHVRLGRATRAGVKAMGLELFSPDDDSSAVVTAIRTPEGIDVAGAASPPARAARRHARPGPGRAQAERLPDRPHRLVRRLRHRRRARRGRALADRARRRHRARGRRQPGLRGLRAARHRLSATADVAGAGRARRARAARRRDRRDDPGVPAKGRRPRRPPRRRSAARSTRS